MYIPENMLKCKVYKVINNGRRQFTSYFHISYFRYIYLNKTFENLKKTHRIEYKIKTQKLRSFTENKNLKKKKIWRNNSVLKAFIIFNKFSFQLQHWCSQFAHYQSLRDDNKYSTVHSGRKDITQHLSDFLMSWVVLLVLFYHFPTSEWFSCILAVNCETCPNKIYGSLNRFLYRIYKKNI